MHLVFYKTSDVFEVEELLNDNNINNEIVPTPVQDKAYCGVCVKTEENERTLELVKNYDYSKVD